MHVLYKQILSALWNTTTRGSTHKPKSTTHFTATIKHPSLSTSSINISAQQFKMPHQKGHVIRSHRVKSDTCWKHTLNVAMISATLQPHPLSHLCGFVRFPRPTFNQLSCITPLSRKLLFMHLGKSYSSQLQYQATSLCLISHQVSAIKAVCKLPACTIEHIITTYGTCVYIYIYI